jgi:hypothetical protein
MCRAPFKVLSFFNLAMKVLEFGLSPLKFEETGSALSWKPVPIAGFKSQPFLLVLANRTSSSCLRATNYSILERSQKAQLKFKIK